MIECSRWWVGGPTALFGHTLSTNAVGGGQGSKKGSKSAVIMYLLSERSRRGSKKAQKLQSSLKYPPLGKWQKGYEVHEGDSVTKGEEGFQGEVGIYMGPKGVGWIPCWPLPFAGPEILKLISLKV